MTEDICNETFDVAGHKLMRSSVHVADDTALENSDPNLQRIITEMLFGVCIIEWRVAGDSEYNLLRTALKEKETPDILLKMDNR